MTENWKPYICNVNGKLASILVNLGLRDAVPIVAKPWLLWIWVYLQIPRSDGLSDSKEAPTLYEIEDALNLRLAHSCQAIACGRITTEGKREFYFYGETNKGLHQAVDQALFAFEGYRFDTGSQKDSEWGHYLEVLYPSEEDAQRIANMDVLDALSEKGDVVTVPREVSHWIYFSAEKFRNLFREAVISAGFEIISETNSEGALPFGIVVARAQPVEQASIDRTVIELFHFAKRFDGEYDGWETQVITQ